MKLQPKLVEATPSYPTHRGLRRGTNRSWKRAVAVVGASLALWLPACGNGSDHARMAGDQEPVRLGGAPPIPDAQANEPPKPPEIPPPEVRTAGVPQKVTPPPVSPTPKEEVRMPGEPIVPAPPSGVETTIKPPPVPTPNADATPPTRLGGVAPMPTKQ